MSSAAGSALDSVHPLKGLLGAVASKLLERGDVKTEPNRGVHALMLHTFVGFDAFVASYHTRLYYTRLYYTHL